jgi:ABC-type transporter Mla subunit MlaD
MPRRLAILLGIAAAVVLAVAVAAWRGQRVVQRVEAVLPNGGGLREGSAVAYRGVLVGIVERIWFEDEGVRMTLGLTRAVPIRSADTLRVHTLGLLGDRVADIRPGPVSAPLLPSGVLLRGHAPMSPVTTDELRELLARQRPLDSIDSTVSQAPRP